MQVRLNIKENSIRKKRGKSYFDGDAKRTLQNLEDPDEPSVNQMVGMIDQSKFIRRGNNV